MDGCGERATDGILERNVKGLGVGWEHIPTVTACSKNMWVLHEVFAWTGKDHAVIVKAHTFPLDVLCGHCCSV